MFKFGAGVEITKEEPQRLHVVIKSALVNEVEQNDDYRLKVPVDSVTRLTVQLHDEEGNLVPINEHMALPVEGRFGAPGRTLSVSFIQGEAVVQTSWITSGEWLVSQQAMNMHLDNSKIEYLFQDLSISVHE